VWFRAESSTSADEVDRILERVVLVRDFVGVPSYQALGRDARGTSASDYADVLEQTGLKAKIQTTKNVNHPAGMVLGVSPAPGTMLAPGAAVTVTAAGS
jgi:beta-lactam-binding protein with PASTA domain